MLFVFENPNQNHFDFDISIISEKLFYLSSFFLKELLWCNTRFSFNNILFSKIIKSWFFKSCSLFVLFYCSFKSFSEIFWCVFWNWFVFNTLLKIIIECFYFLWFCLCLCLWSYSLALTIFFLLFSIALISSISFCVSFCFLNSVNSFSIWIIYLS